MQGLTIRPTLVALALTAAFGVQATALTAAGLGPAASAPASPHAVPGLLPRATKQNAAPAAPVKLVDINSANRKELMTLPGIGAAEAARIVANRPYMTKTELVTKGVLPTGPFLALKYQVVAMHYTKPVGKTAQPSTAGAAASGSKAP